MYERNEYTISRRRLLGAMATMGAAAMGAGLLGGCSSPRAESSSSSAASSGVQSSGSSQGSSVSSSSSASSSAASSSSAQAQAQAQAAGGAIVAVFSWSGNTLAVADRVAEDLQAELFRIEPATPYTSNYDEMLQIAQDERSANTLPAIAGSVSGWDRYSTVYLGFPTWWGHLPQIVKSFLSNHSCAGKVVYPFNTHGGSGFASCLADLAEACPGADVRNGLSLLGDNATASTAQIDSWVNASL